MVRSEVRSRRYVLPPPPPPVELSPCFRAIMIHSTRALFGLHNQVQTLLTTLQSMAVSLESISFTRCQDSLHCNNGPLHPCRDIQLGDDLCRLGRTLLALVAHEDDLRSTLTSIRQKCNIVSPINHLPDEVLVQIFQHLLSSPNFYQPQDRLINVTKISGVCKRWRSVCVGAAAFWGPLHSLGSPLTELCIIRSRDHPIHINLRGSYPRSNLVPFSQVVCDAIVHWQTLSLDFNIFDSAESLFRLFVTQCERFPSVAPRLQNLSLSYQGSFSTLTESSSGAFQALISASPHLRTLELSRFHLDPFVPHFICLTSLSIANTSIKPSYLDHVLTTCTQLRKLTLVYLLDLVPLEPSAGIPIILPHLEEVTARGCSPHIHAHICNFLGTPALQRLSIAASIHPRLTFDAGLAAFMRRNPCATIVLSHFLGSSVAETFPSLSHVRKLIICFTTPSPQVSRHILNLIPGGSFPNLAEMHIEALASPTLDLEGFLERRSVAFGTPFPLPISMTFSWPLRYAVEQMESDRKWLNERVHLRC